MLPSPLLRPVPLRSALDRRSFLTGSLATMGLAALAACSSAPAAPPATSRDFTVGGSVVQIPIDPQRVVSISTFTQDAMFDLGKDPIGVYDPGEEYILAAFLDRWKSIPKISGSTVGGQLDLEKISGLTPDLIIGIDAQKAPLDQLSKIAPTVLLPFSASPTIWRDLAGETADAVNRADAVATLKTRYTDRVAQIRKDHADVLGRVRFDILQGGFDDGSYWVYGADSTFGGLLADVGAQFATASAGTTGGNRSVSLEEIGLLRDADAIFYYTNSDGTPANNGPALFAHPLFTTLPAVAAGRVFGTPHFLPASYTDAFGAFDDLEAALTKLR